jgi:hypothetical protein
MLVLQASIYGHQYQLIELDITMHKIFKILPIAVVALSFLARTNPALAGLVNEKISDISDNELINYCGRKMGAGTSPVEIKRGDRSVGCTIRVQERNNTNVRGSGNVSGNVYGGYGNASGSVNGSGGSATQNVYTYRTQSYRLTDYCREMVDRGFSNPFTGEGRVFVGDGGASCFKTVNR